MKQTIIFAAWLFIGLSSCINNPKVESKQVLNENSPTPSEMDVQVPTPPPPPRAEIKFVPPQDDFQNRTNSNKTIADFYKKFEKKSQTFTIPNDKDTTLFFAEGTSVKIKAHSFVSRKTSRGPNADIDISVKEYYKISDIVLADLTTTSGDEILETGGMLYVTATSKGEEYDLKKGEFIEIGFPYKEKKEGMQIFTGNRNANDIMDWQLQTTEIGKEEDAPPTDSIYEYVEEMPRFPTGDESLLKFLARNVVYPNKAMEDGTEGTVIVQFIVTAKGDLRDFKIIKSLSPETDQAVLDAMIRMPNWIPGKMSGNTVDVIYTLPVRFRLDGTGSLDYSPDATYFGTKVLPNSSIAGISKIVETGRYLLKSFNLFWINCDHFQRMDLVKTNIKFEKKSDKYLTKVYAILQKSKTILPVEILESSAIISCQANRKVIVLAIRYEGNQTYIAVKNIVTGVEQIEALSFELADERKLAEILGKLGDVL